MRRWRVLKVKHMVGERAILDTRYVSWEWSALEKRVEA